MREILEERSLEYQLIVLIAAAIVLYGVCDYARAMFNLMTQLRLQ